MKIGEQKYRTIWLADDGWRVNVIDQTKLPFALEIRSLSTFQEAALAISDMIVRGAPLIGATAAYGVALAMREDSSDFHLSIASEHLRGTRPTAINLAWALEKMRDHLIPLSPNERAKAAYDKAATICESDVAICKSIGRHGLELIKRSVKTNDKKPLNILTHCNAGWLACVDWGTALAPIYMAHDEGIPVHVWVDETRPRNQGAALTAFELGAHGVPHTVISDNTGGHLMQRGEVQMVMVGSDRTTYAGDVCNKIGTYLKALAAFESRIPFYVALPSTTIDWATKNGDQIPIEERDSREITFVSGKQPDGSIAQVQITPDNSTVLNVAFDITPAKFVTGLITERGVCDPTEKGIRRLFPNDSESAAQ